LWDVLQTIAEGTSEGKMPMKRILKAFVVPFLVIVAFGCGDEEGEGNSKDSMTREQFAGIYPKSYCGWLFRCCNTDEKGSQYSSEGDCVIDQKDEIYKTLKSWNQAYWDGEGAAKLDSLYNSISCEEIKRTHVLGLNKNQGVGLGESCTRSIDCTSQNCVGKICAKQGSKEGHPCSWLDQVWGYPVCTTEFFCDLTKDICRGKLLDGQTCTSNYECRSGICASTAKKCVTTSGYICDGK